MFCVIFSPKQGGIGHLKSFDNREVLIKRLGRSAATYPYKTALLSFCLLVFSAVFVISAGAGKSAYVPSKAAAKQCSEKLDDLEDFAAKHKTGQKRTTKFSQDEINSYLALDLSVHYHPCLKSLLVDLFEENEVQAVASIDFDQLKSSSTKAATKLIGLLFSGTHTLTVKGKLLSKDGKAHFSLDQARFDDTTLPQSIVEPIISAVGRKQKTPFDPLQPSKVFYEIDKVDIHSGYLIVYQ
jgi:hypothetical protein